MAAPSIALFSGKKEIQFPLLTFIGTSHSLAKCMGFAYWYEGMEMFTQITTSSDITLSELNTISSDVAF